VIFDSFFKSINFDVKKLKKYRKIFVLVSGGIDSTLLAHYIYSHFPNKVFFINCFNPYEQSITLKYFSSKANYMQLSPDSEINYSDILEKAFLNLNKAFGLVQNGKYSKKVFGCCYYIKHKAFLHNKMFRDFKSVVVSGIKAGDGKQRRSFLSGLRKRDTFIHRHCKQRHNINYIYPFRDYFKSDLPSYVLNKLQKFYPKLEHSACKICPVVILFKLIKSSNYAASKAYYDKLVKCGKIIPIGGVNYN
jgi:3'-phosphoadenosine 5'-phosphosulfate sulfotransferase (PAPS reductase)/FAD synthetase